MQPPARSHLPAAAQAADLLAAAPHPPEPPSGGKFSHVTINDNTRRKQDICSAAAGTTTAGTLLSGDLAAEGDAGFFSPQEVIRDQTEESTVVNLM